MLSLLRTLSDWVDQIPPSQTSLRYGNPSYRTWSTRLLDQAPQLLADLLPDPLQGAGVELLPYLLDSFGNPTRIDYGTGHETNFVALLYCLARLGVFVEVRTVCTRPCSHLHQGCVQSADNTWTQC